MSSSGSSLSVPVGHPVVEVEARSAEVGREKSTLAPRVSVEGILWPVKVNPGVARVLPPAAPVLSVRLNGVANVKPCPSEPVALVEGLCGGGEAWGAARVDRWRSS